MVGLDRIVHQAYDIGHYHLQVYVVATVGDHNTDGWHRSDEQIRLVSNPSPRGGGI